VLALPFGLFVGFNTGNLVSATSVPIWARNWMLMGPTFLASGVSTALSWLSLVLHLGHWGEEKTLRVLHRAEKAVIVIEGVLIALSLARMSRWSKPLFSKEVAPLFVGGTLSPVSLHPSPCSPARRAAPKACWPRCSRSRAASRSASRS
jgi:hypothetical protein